jgi:hypothetical protein
MCQPWRSNTARGPLPIVAHRSGTQEMLSAAGALLLDQTWPFQTSANQVVVPGSSVSTNVACRTIATQRLADAHETVAELESSPKSSPTSARCTVHLVPSHRSNTPTPLPVASACPAAKHALALGHEIDVSLTPLPLGLGTRSAVHRTPSQRAAPSPTAMHRLPDTHDTASLTYGGGARIADHVRPFHRAARLEKPEVIGL